MRRKWAAFAGGGLVAVVLFGTAMLAWTNGAFGTPAVDRVGTFRMMQAKHAPSTTTHVPASLVPRTSPPDEIVETTRPTVAATEVTSAPQSSVATATDPVVEHVTSTSRPEPHSGDEIEPPDRPEPPERDD